MIRLEMKNYDTILIEKQPKYLTLSSGKISTLSSGKIHKLLPSNQQ